MPLAVFGYSVVDELGVRANVSIPASLSGGMTLTQADTAWGDGQTALEGIIDGKVMRGDVTIRQVGAGGTPAAGSRVEENAVFNFGVTGTAHRYGIAVPTFKSSLQTAGVITLTGATATWTDLVVAAITGGGNYSTPDGVALTALVDAFLSFRKHRKPLRAVSYEQA